MTKRKRNFKQNKPVKFVKYGNWCGPGWTAGQAKAAEAMSSSDYNVPAVDGIDAACKQHDIAIHEADSKEDVKKANQEFVMDASGQGYTGKVMGQLVDWFGPTDISPAKKDPHFSKSKEGKKQIAKKLKMAQDPIFDSFHRRPEPVQPDVNHDMGRSVASGTLVRSKNNQGETAVDKLPTLTYLPFKHTQQVFMKYRAYNILSMASGAVGSTSCVADTFRLNSIYDCRSAYAFTSDPTAAADSADTFVNCPTLRNYWMNFYRYWTVTKSYYRVKVWTTTKSNSGEVCVYVYKHGQQFPPARNYLADTRIEHFVRKQHPNVMYKKLYTVGASETDYNLYEDKVEVIEGEWTPGSITNTVAEDELSETWHKVSEVPSHRQLLTIMCQRSERAEDIAYSVSYEIEMVYEVQLKDLKAQHEFISNDSGIPQIVSYYAQEN